METPNTRAEIARLEREIKRLQSDWITEAEAMEILGVKLRTIQEMRYKGQFKKLRCRSTNRGFQYSRSEVESLLITTK